MAYEDNLQRISLPANADLSASQYCFVVVNSSGKVALASDGAKADGVLQDKPAAADRAAQIGIDGVTKMKAGAAITAGDDVAVGSSGKGATATTGEVVVARALETATGDGSIISVLLQRSSEPLA